MEIGYIENVVTPDADKQPVIRGLNMKLMPVKIVITLFILAMPLTATAYIHQDSSNRTINPAPTRLIVKLEADLKTNLSYHKSGVPEIGIAAFDRLNLKYSVSNQEYLYPDAGIMQRPDILKNTFVVEIPESTDIDALIKDYNSLSEVEYAEPDVRLELYEIPDDPLYQHQWGLNNTGQAYYHVERFEGCGNDIQTTTSGIADSDIDAHEVFANPPDNTVTVILAMIDTGVDLDHPELSGRIWVNPNEIPGNGFDDDHNGYIDDVNGWDFAGDNSMAIPPEEDNDPTDLHGHGTHCSGIITAVAGNGAGVAGILDDCRIMALNFAPVMLSSYAVRAIVYAADNGADVISMSWGYPLGGYGA